jgi:hypothetical protein
MRLVKRVVIIAVAAFALWIIVLAILGAVVGGREQRKTSERLAKSLQAKVTIGASDLALIRGRLTLDNLAIRRDEAAGHLWIDVGNVRCELAPLGGALFDHDCRELSVRGVKVEVSTAALFKLPPPAKSKPIHTDRLVIDDAHFVFLPSAIAPSLGRIEISIDHAVAGATTLRTPLSWLFALEVLEAHFALPAGITLQLSYRLGLLTVSGSVFGSTPVTLPVTLPAADLAHDAHEEMQLLVGVGKDVAERLVAQRATDWLRSKLQR